MKDPRRPLPRRSGDQTRELLLLAGMLVVDEAVASEDAEQYGRWLGHVGFDDVLEVAKRVQLYLDHHATELPEGAALSRWLREHRSEIMTYDTEAFRNISKATAYTVFDNEADFHANLATRLLSLERVTDDGALLAAWGELSDASDGPLELGATIAHLADVEFRRIRGLEATFVDLGAAAFAGHPEIRALLRATLEASAYEQGEMLELYEGMLAAFGRRMRHGATPLDLFTVLSGLVYGLSWHHRAWPESVRDDIPWDGGTRSAFALSVEAIVEHLTEPVEVPEASERARRTPGPHALQHPPRLSDYDSSSVQGTAARARRRDDRSAQGNRTAGGQA